MPPYGRDAGLTEPAAARLAEQVRAAVPGSVAVEREGRYFVVVVDGPTGRHALRDEVDWRWLQKRLTPPG